MSRPKSLKPKHRHHAATARGFVVLDGKYIYTRPHDSKRPVVRMDETFKQLIGQTRDPLPPGPGHVERFDHVDVRNGVASLFLAFEPPAGWRTVTVTDHRRRLEWAQFIKSLVDGRYKDAETTVDWQFTTAEARIKLKRLYPSNHV